jgi:ribose 1,5-bisphosphokinase PhnN
MIPDIVEKLVRSKIDEELKKLKEGGMAPAELEAVANEARAAFAERTQKFREQAAPLLDAAKETLRQVLGVPSRAELQDLTERLERAVAALERAEAEAKNRAKS